MAPRTVPRANLKPPGTSDGPRPSLLTSRAPRRQYGTSSPNDGRNLHWLVQLWLRCPARQLEHRRRSISAVSETWTASMEPETATARAVRTLRREMVTDSGPAAGPSRPQGRPARRGSGAAFWQGPGLSLCAKLGCAPLESASGDGCLEFVLNPNPSICGPQALGPASGVCVAGGCQAHSVRTAL